MTKSWIFLCLLAIVNYVKILFSSDYPSNTPQLTHNLMGLTYVFTDYYLYGRALKYDFIQNPALFISLKSKISPFVAQKYSEGLSLSNKELKKLFKKCQASDLVLNKVVRKLARSYYKIVFRELKYVMVPSKHVHLRIFDAFKQNNIVLFTCSTQINAQTGTILVRNYKIFSNLKKLIQKRRAEPIADVKIHDSIVPLDPHDASCDETYSSTSESSIDISTSDSSIESSVDSLCSRSSNSNSSSSSSDGPRQFVQIPINPESTVFIYIGLRNYNAIRCYASPIVILASIEELTENTQLARQVSSNGHEIVLDLRNLESISRSRTLTLSRKFFESTNTYLKYVFVSPNLRLKGTNVILSEIENVQVLISTKILNSESDFDNIDFSGLVLVYFRKNDASSLLRRISQKMNLISNRSKSLIECLNVKEGEIAGDVITNLQNLITFTESLHPRVLLNYSTKSTSCNVLNVRRGENLLKDSCHLIQYISKENMMRKQFYIAFRDEEGVDHGGLTKEWFSLLMREFVSEKHGLFKPSNADQSTFHPCEFSNIKNPEKHLQYFRLCGIILAKGIYDGLPLQFKLSSALRKLMLGKALDIFDLKELEPELFNSLNWIADNEISDEMTFSTDCENHLGEHVGQVDLIPGGSLIYVTDENKFEYINHVIYYKLHDCVQLQIEAFLSGFHSLISKETLEKYFSVRQLDQVISGSAPLDVEDWKRNTEYSGGFTAESLQIINFWRAVQSFTDSERRLLLKFVSGTVSVPLEGFSHLRIGRTIKLFTIVPDLGTCLQNLPKAHTCYCRLDLPLYPTYEILREKVLLAIYEGNDGFLID
jgi:hypothetical protein